MHDDGGLDGPQTLIHIAHQTVTNHNTDADNASASHNQAGRCVLLMCGVVDSSGYLVEGTAGLHDWQTIPD
jgi:hypothetical protein